MFGTFWPVFNFNRANKKGEPNFFRCHADFIVQSLFIDQWAIHVMDCLHPFSIVHDKFLTHETKMFFLSYLVFSIWVTILKQLFASGSVSIRFLYNIHWRCNILLPLRVFMTCKLNLVNWKLKRCNIFFTSQIFIDL